MRNKVDAEEKQQDREGDELNSVSSISYRTIDCLGVEEDRTAGSNATRTAGPLEIFAAGVIANVAWNAICSHDVGFSFDDSRYPRYTCPWQIARETVRINCLHERRRRLHTYTAWRRRMAPWRDESEHSTPLFPSLAPIRSCEYLVTVNYTRYRFIFFWQVRATIPWVLSPIPVWIHRFHPRLP